MSVDVLHARNNEVVVGSNECGCTSRSKYQMVVNVYMVLLVVNVVEYLRDTRVSTDDNSVAWCYFRKRYYPQGLQEITVCPTVRPPFCALEPLGFSTPK